MLTWVSMCIYPLPDRYDNYVINTISSQNWMLKRKCSDDASVLLIYSFLYLRLTHVVPITVLPSLANGSKIWPLHSTCFTYFSLLLLLKEIEATLWLIVEYHTYLFLWKFRASGCRSYLLLELRSDSLLTRVLTTLGGLSLSLSLLA